MSMRNILLSTLSLIAVSSIAHAESRYQGLQIGVLGSVDSNLEIWNDWGTWKQADSINNGYYISYQHDFDNFVLGIEYSKSKFLGYVPGTGDSLDPDYYTYKEYEDLSLKAGLPFGEGWLAYALAGISNGIDTEWMYVPELNTPWSMSGKHYGVGIEHYSDNGIVASIEYRIRDFNNVSYQGNQDIYDMDNQSIIFKIGYKF